MAKALEGQDQVLNHYGLAFTKDAENLIAAIQSSQPSRDPQEYKSNLHGWYPSRMMAGMIKAESRRVEFPGLLEAEGDDVL